MGPTCIRFLKHGMHGQFGTPLLRSWSAVLSHVRLEPRCSKTLSTAKHKQQISTAAKVREGSNKTRGAPEATELKSALASYSGNCLSVLAAELSRSSCSSKAPSRIKLCGSCGNEGKA